MIVVVDIEAHDLKWSQLFKDTVEWNDPKCL
jgi:hypothetical protein